MLKTLLSKKWILIVGGVVLVAGIGLGVAALLYLGGLPWQPSTVYKDPQGRFSMNVDPSWEKIETDGDYVHFRMPDPPLNVYLLPLQANTVDDAFNRAFQTVGFDTDLLASGGRASLGDWYLFSTEDAQGLTYGLAGQTVGPDAYVFMVKSEVPGVNPENAAVFRALSSVEIAGKQEVVIGSLTELEALVRQRVDDSTGSVSIALVDHGKIAYTYAYGTANAVAGTPADPETIYQYGSMTKMFTATALMQLVEEGRVNLDAWPGEYVPEFPAAWQVTVRQLLDHSACMSDDDRLTKRLIEMGTDPFPPLADVFSTYVQEYPDLACEPGRVSQYSNPHYLALARIIEEVSGEPYDTYVQTHVLTPLEMPSTGFQLVAADERYARNQMPAADAEKLVDRLNEYIGPGQERFILNPGEPYSTLALYRVLPPWGGLRGTPSEVTHFLQMHLHGGRYGDAQVLKPETVAAMQVMQPASGGGDLGLGLGWWPGEDAAGAFLYHSGGVEGGQTTMRFYPGLDLGVVVMGNMQGYQPEAIADDLVSAWLHESN